MTPLQRFNLAVYFFLDPYYKPQTQSETCGKVGRDVCGDESVSGDNISVVDEQGPRTLAVVTPETNKPSASKSSENGLSEVLVHYLEKSAKETKDTEQKVQALQTQTTVAAQKVERTAWPWAEWLVSVQCEISEARYRDYQADSFNMVMRYIRDAHQPQPAPQFRPFNAHPVRAQEQQQQQQQQQFAQLQTSYPARVLSASAPPVFSWDFGTSLSFGVSSSSSTSIINQAWTLSDQPASPLCTPYKRSSLGFSTFLDTHSPVYIGRLWRRCHRFYERPLGHSAARIRHPDKRPPHSET